MKLIFALIILVGCTSRPINSPTESDAKLVTPQSMKVCACTKIFRPVCADGQTFANSCMAECGGYKKWSEGPCQ